MPRTKARWIPWLLLGALLVGAAYSASGYAMAGSFMIANPERPAEWQRAGTLYGAGAVGCLLLAVALAAYLVRAGRRSGEKQAVTQVKLRKIPAAPPGE